MTAPTDIEAMRALLAAATPGPWLDDADPPDDVVIWGRVPDQGSMLVANVCATRVGLVGVALDVDARNARLIVAAVNALPTLLDELAAARAVNEMLQSQLVVAIDAQTEAVFANADAGVHCAKAHAERDAALARVAELETDKAKRCEYCAAVARAEGKIGYICMGHT